MKKSMHFGPVFSAIVFVALTFNFRAAYGQEHLNSVTFDNRSGEPALVKIIGPANTTVNVSHGTTQTVKVGAGDYYILVRYGSDPSKFSFTQGDSFTIEQTEKHYSVITITLHKVIGGNYQARPISKEMFEQAALGVRSVQFSRSNPPLAPKHLSSTDNLIVGSFPSGLKTYITPLDKFTGGGIDIVNWTSKKFLVGTTPLEVPLKPGEYRVAITNYDNPFEFRRDGEDEFLNILVQTEKGFSEINGGKVYSVFKRAGHKAILTALFCPVGQSIEDFVKGLPNEDLFDIDPWQTSFEKRFREHKVPKKEWKHLLTMLRKTGKAVWHSDEPSHWLYIYFGELREDGMPYRLYVGPVAMN
jgi:hypothetical protein